MEYFLELSVVDDLEALRQDWTMLEKESSCSYFQSWGWIGTWLKEVANDLECEVVRVKDKKELIGIGVFAKTHVSKTGRLDSRKLFLNEAPSDNRNMVIEYNGLLVKKGYEEKIYKEVIHYVCSASNDWDELYLNNIPESITKPFVNQLEQGFFCTIDRQLTSWQYDSSELTGGEDEIYSGLSRNRRYQIKKAFQAYQKEGNVELVEASSEKEAQLFFDGLKQLHMQRWGTKGISGSFSNTLWEKFHRAIISDRFQHGEVQLLKVAAGDNVIGYVYNFVWRNRVYVLQTGFNMDVPKNGQPGYVSHLKAILHNHNKNNNIYDLMTDDSGYKSILCNRSERLVSVSFKRISIKSMIRVLSRSDIKNGYLKKCCQSLWRR